MPGTKLEFSNYAQWAAWTSAASSANPYKRIGSSPLLGTKGGFAAEGFTRAVFMEAVSKCKEGELSCEMPAVDVPDVRNEVEEILRPHGLSISFQEDKTVISWDRLNEQLPSQPYRLETMPFGVWAYWIAKAVLAIPAEKFTRVDKVVERRLEGTRFVWVLQTRLAAIDGLTETTVHVELVVEQLLEIIRNDLRLNGFRRFDESDDPEGNREFRIHIRQAQPNMMSQSGGSSTTRH